MIKRITESMLKKRKSGKNKVKETLLEGGNTLTDCKKNTGDITFAVDKKTPAANGEKIVPRTEESVSENSRDEESSDNGDSLSQESNSGKLSDESSCEYEKADKIEGNQSSDDDSSDSSACEVRNAAMSQSDEGSSSDSQSVKEVNSNEDSSSGDATKDNAVSKKRTGDESGSSDSNSEEGSVEEEQLEFKIFVKGLHFDATKADVEKKFAQCGDIVRVSVPEQNSSRNKGFAIVVFSTESAYKKAFKLDNTEICGRSINVQESKESVHSDSAELFVGNLSYEVKKEDLLNMFEKLGKVRNLSLPIDRDNEGRCKGFAFVEFENKKDAEKVRKMGLKHDGRKLFIKDSNKQKGNGFAGRPSADKRHDGGRQGKNNFGDRFERKNNRHDDFSKKGDNGKRKHENGQMISKKTRFNDSSE